MIGGLWWAPALSRLNLSRLLFGGGKVTADRPHGFGYKMAWVAVKTRDTAKLINVLQLSDARSADWSTGIAAVYSERVGLDRVFVTPPIDGWSHVVGLSLPHPMSDAFQDRCAPFLTNLSREFGSVNYYASFPELEYFAWAYLRNGELKRGFACSSEGVLWNRGRVLADERSVGLEWLNIRAVADDESAGTNHQLREQQVLELARRWSLDPTHLEARDDLEASVGYLATAPTDWQPTEGSRPRAWCNSARFRRLRLK